MGGVWCLGWLYRVRRIIWALVSEIALDRKCTGRLLSNKGGREKDESPMESSGTARLWDEGLSSPRDVDTRDRRRIGGGKIIIAPRKVILSWFGLYVKIY